MIVQFGRNDEVAIDGGVLTADQLDQVLRKRLSDNPPSGARIKAHGAASASDVIALVARLGDAGIEDLKIMTVTRRP